MDYVNHAKSVSQYANIKSKAEQKYNSPLVVTNDINMISTAQMPPQIWEEVIIEWNSL